MNQYLSAELFRGELESRRDLLGENFGIAEAKRVQGDLSYHSIVGYHHGHGTKQGLQEDNCTEHRLRILIVM